VAELTQRLRRRLRSAAPVFAISAATAKAAATDVAVHEFLARRRVPRSRRRPATCGSNGRPAGAR